MPEPIKTRGGVQHKITILFKTNTTKDSSKRMSVKMCVGWLKGTRETKKHKNNLKTT